MANVIYMYALPFAWSLTEYHWVKYITFLASFALAANITHFDGIGILSQHEGIVQRLLFTQGYIKRL